MRRTQAVLGGEGNGGIIDPQVHLGRDAAVAAVWLAEAHAKSTNGLAGLASAIPPRYLRKGKLSIRDEKAVLESLQPHLGRPDDRSDGFRWQRSEGFVHVRFSATEPILRVIVEAGSAQAADELFGRVVGVATEGHRR
jgi:phosphomannomutase